MKKYLSILLAILLVLNCNTVYTEDFASDYVAMNEAAASVLVLTLYDENDKEIGTASGFMAFDDSHAVTTFLAINTAARVEVVTDEGEKLGTFKVLGCDSDCNLAIIAFDQPTGLKPLELNEEGSVNRGAACVSIGAQNGVNSITTGNVATTFTAMGLNLIQFTASIAEGASGGALLDENGKVVGITLLGISGEIGYTVVQNMNFALSVSHLMVLWNFCKEDEPVDLTDWKVTDINPDSVDYSRSDKMSLNNESGYSIHSFTIYSGGKSSRRYAFDGWLKNGENAEIQFTVDELLAEEPLYISFYMRYSGEDIRFEQDIPIEDLLGKTMCVSIKDSMDQWGNHVKKPILVPSKANETDSEQRHVKEITETDDDFIIPEEIEYERRFPRNICVIYNDTDYTIYKVSLFQVETYTYFELFTDSVEPGDWCKVEFPEALVNDSGKYTWRITVRLEGKRNAFFIAQIDTKNTADLCGQVVYTKYDAKASKPYLEIQ